MDEALLAWLTHQPRCLEREVTATPTLTHFLCFLVIPKAVWLWCKGFLSDRKGSLHDVFTKPLPCITKVMSPLVSCPSWKLLLLSHSILSNSLQPHGLQHTRPPCPSPTPGVYRNSYTLSQWCHPTISSSVVPFSSHLQSFPPLGSFPMSQFFSSGGQNIGSFSFSISPSNEYSGLISFRMDWLDLLAVQGTPKSLLQHHSLESINSLALSFLYGSSRTSVHDYWINHSFD